MIFRDRIEAGELLAGALTRFADNQLRVPVGALHSPPTIATHTSPVIIVMALDSLLIHVKMERSAAEQTISSSGDKPS